MVDPVIFAAWVEQWFCNWLLFELLLPRSAIAQKYAGAIAEVQRDFMRAAMVAGNLHGLIYIFFARSSMQRL